MELLLATDNSGSTALHWTAHMGQLEASRALAGSGGKRLLAVIDGQGLTAEDHARAAGHGELALMLLRSRLGKGRAYVRGQAGPCVSEQEVALASEKANAAMAALLAEESEASKDGAAGAARGSKSGKAGGQDMGGGNKKTK